MKKPVLIVPVVAALLALPALASSADSWLHVKVQEKGLRNGFLASRSVPTATTV